MKRLVDAFELPAPKLVILLNLSPGTEYECGLVSSTTEGRVTGFTFPYPSRADCKQTEEDLMHFMREVVLPLAVETHAIVICQAAKGVCLLLQACSR